MPDNKLIDALNQLLADHAVYYQKLRNYHWNVKGPAFFQLHQKFEEMYLLAQEHVDSIAERILALGGHPHSTMQAYLEASRITEDPRTPDAHEMVHGLRADIEALSGSSREVRALAEERGDDTTINLLDEIADVQAQDAWMLRAWLG